ncbi:MAG TPA: hypothetical protein VF989_03020 [Polyangiaceae bacterium]
MKRLRRRPRRILSRAVIGRAVLLGVAVGLVAEGARAADPEIIVLDEEPAPTAPKKKPQPKPKPKSKPKPKPTSEPTKPAPEPEAEPPAKAPAAAPDGVIVVGKFSGPQGGSVRQWVISALEGDGSIEVVGDGAGTELGPDAKDAQIASGAKQARAKAVITGKVTLQKKVGWGLKLQVRNGLDGTLIEEVKVKGGLLPNLQRNIEKSAPDSLSAPLAKAEAHPVEPEPEDETEAAPSAPLRFSSDDKPEDGAPVDKPSPLYARLGVRVYRRDFSYLDTLQDQYPNGGYPPLLTYKSSPVAPSLSLLVDVFPLAFLTGGMVANVGLSLGFETGFATAATDSTGQTLDISATTLFVGPRYRAFFGEADAKTGDRSDVSPFVAVGSHDFSIGDNLELPNRTPIDLPPNVDYEFFDMGIDSRLLLGGLWLGPFAKFRWVSSVGDIGGPMAFPNAAAWAFAAGINGGIPVFDVFEIAVGLEYLQYAFDFNPVGAERNPIVAGGAIDRYISGWLGVGARLPGTVAKPAP